MNNKTGDALSKNNETPKGKISKTIWTPNSSETLKTNSSKTPYSLRNQLRKSKLNRLTNHMIYFRNKLFQESPGLLKTGER